MTAEDAVGFDHDECSNCGAECRLENDPSWYILEDGRIVRWCYPCAHYYDGKITDLR